LLYLLNKIQSTQKIYFIDTTYHFQETLQYKKDLIERFGLEVIDIRPNERENRITREESWWIDHPKMCCSVNKVVPLEPIKAKHKVWISGLMSYQTEFRSHLRIFEQQGDIIKFHPIIDIEEAEFLYQMGVNQLQLHPLEELGFGSIGCIHCTKKGEGRSGRWKGTDKTECGLHPGYFLNRKKAKLA
jgi:phosphoadenosine phosphosulfate reductase